jgi:hypothetical protein
MAKRDREEVDLASRPASENRAVGRRSRREARLGDGCDPGGRRTRDIQVRRSRDGAPVTSDPALFVSMASPKGCLAVALARRAVGVDIEAVTPLDPMRPVRRSEAGAIGGPASGRTRLVKDAPIEPIRAGQPSHDVREGEVSPFMMIERSPTIASAPTEAS